MEDALKALLVRALVFTESALNIMQLEGQMLRAALTEEIRKAEQKPAEEKE